MPMPSIWCVPATPVEIIAELAGSRARMRAELCASRKACETPMSIPAVPTPPQKA